MKRGSAKARARLGCALGGVAVALTLLCASTASATVSLCNVPITMSDGTVLRANVFLPDTSGHYPTVLTATGYNKDAGNPTGQECGSSQGIAGDEPALAEKGFAVMVIDDRGTGASGGKWDSWGQRTQQDYKEVLDWIQAQPWSNSKVATTGESYMGITSLLIAEADAARVAEGKQRAVTGGVGRHPDGGRLPRRHLPGWLAGLGLHAAVARAGQCLV